MSYGEKEADFHKDSDGVGWTDIEEARLGLDPHNADSDGDGIPDGRDVCPNYAATPADARNDDLAILQHTVFAAFGFSGSRRLLLAYPNGPDPRNPHSLRRIQPWGYGGPILFGPTREAWNSPHDVADGRIWIRRTDTLQLHCGVIDVKERVVGLSYITNW